VRALGQFLAGAALAAASARWASALQLPPAQCSAAASCQPSGFQTLRDEAGESGSFFGLRARFGRGLEFGIVRPPGWSDPFARDPVQAAANLFVRRHPLKGRSRPPDPNGVFRPEAPPVENPRPPVP